MADFAKQKTLSEIVPRKRSQEERRYSDGTREIRCFSPANPHYFKDAGGTLHAIDMDVETQAASKVAPSKLRSKNVTSAGVRADGGLYKLVGLRPDFSQANGTHQLEFSLVNVSIDGVDQNITSEVSAPVASLKDSRAWDMGRFQVIPNRRFCRQAVLIDRPKTSFRIEFLIHIKGLTISPVDVPGRSCWHVRDGSGEVDWMISEPLILDDHFDIIRTEDADGRPVALITHSLTDNKDGTFTYVKESVKDADFSGLPAQFWVDASTVYSSTADGYASACSVTSWSAVRGATTANYSVDDSGPSISMTTMETSGYFFIFRGFLYFDTSDITGSVASCDFTVYPNNGNGTDDSLYIQQGTQGSSLSSSDFNTFSGSAYADSFSMIDDEFTVVSFNSTGISGVDTDGTTKLCVREAHDFEDDEVATDTSYGGSFHSADQSGTTYDPYLSITVATTSTLSSSLSGLIQKSGVFTSTSIQAAIQAQQLKNLSADGAVAVQHDISVSPDGAIQAGHDVFVSPDGAIQAGQNISVSADGAVAFGKTISTSPDAAVSQTAGITVMTDAAVSQDQDIFITTDGEVQRTDAASVSADAAVEAGREMSAMADAAVESGQVRVLGLDAQVGVTVSAVADIDGAILDSRSAIADMDAWAGAVQSATVGLSGALRAGQNINVSQDGAIQAEQNISVSQDVAIQAGQNISVPADGVLQSGRGAAAEVDAMVQSGAVISADMSAVLRQRQSLAVDIDMAIYHITGRLYYADAALSVSPSVTTGLDGAVMQDGAISFDVDSVIASGKAACASLSGLIQQSQFSVTGINAVISPGFYQAPVFLSAGIKQRAVSLSVSADGPVQARNQRSGSVDAAVAGAGIAGISADAVVFQPGQSLPLIIEGATMHPCALPVELDSRVQSHQYLSGDLDAGIMTGRAVDLGVAAGVMAHLSNGVFVDSPVQSRGHTGFTRMSAGVMVPADAFVAVDAMTRQVHGVSVDVDGAVRKQATVFAAAGGVLQSGQAGSVSIGGCLVVPGDIFCNMDSTRYVRRTVAGDLDGAVQALDHTGLTRMSAGIQARATEDTGLDSRVRRRWNINTTVDSAVLQRQQVGFSIGSAVEAGKTGVASVDAALQKGFDVSLVLDALCAFCHTETSGLDAIIEATAVTVASMSGLILGADDLGLTGHHDFVLYPPGVRTVRCGPQDKTARYGRRNLITNDE